MVRVPFRRSLGNLTCRVSGGAGACRAVPCPPVTEGEHRRDHHRSTDQQRSSRHVMPSVVRGGRRSPLNGGGGPGRGVRLASVRNGSDHVNGPRCTPPLLRASRSNRRARLRAGLCGVCNGSSIEAEPARVGEFVAGVQAAVAVAFTGYEDQPDGDLADVVRRAVFAPDEAVTTGEHIADAVRPSSGSRGGRRTEVGWVRSFVTPKGKRRANRDSRQRCPGGRLWPSAQSLAFAGRSRAAQSLLRSY